MIAGPPSCGESQHATPSVAGCNHGRPPVARNAGIACGTLLAGARSDVTQGAVAHRDVPSLETFSQERSSDSAEALPRP